MEQNPVSPNIIDTTDSLEAVNVFKSMKNFSFWLVILSLLILMTMFLMARFGWIEEPQASQTENRPGISFLSSFPRGGLITLAAQSDTPQPENSEPAPAAAEPEKKAEGEEQYDPIAQQAREITNQDESDTAEKPAVQEQEPTRAQPQTEGPGEPFFDVEKIKPTPRQATLIINIFNYVCLISAILYSLTLLFALKVSLTSRLGGIKHISRAFFLSLFALVFLFPWQTILPRVLIGAIYLPEELLGPRSLLAGNDVVAFLRFAGLWLIVFFLYIWAQFRSVKWARAILRRLGIVR